MSHSPKPSAPNPHPIDLGVSIGHVHLKVADLSRAIAFYCGVLGFDLMQHYGDEAAFLSAGGYHHHIALKHLGKQRRVAAWTGHNGTLLCYSLSHAGGIGRCATQVD
jgi:catechol-2,3-dioxygenase